VPVAFVPKDSLMTVSVALNKSTPSLRFAEKTFPINWLACAFWKRSIRRRCYMPEIPALPITFKPK
jgi:hypothetical protein